ncbi:hypothetical protein BMMGA3_14872 [Bacillus methanolicus MGA3]|uniref:Uncharacterized protein n=1 Tax=Bacillus methanolicus (strain MGA3 / ATCC 53907) TaxID=796606 RepID=A0A0B5L6B4_BACMM|nr:hypothetical protein BMMGA3_14872 [Bacillus methanolicus MGA3]
MKTVVICFCSIFINSSRTIPLAFSSFFFSIMCLMHLIPH